MPGSELLYQKDICTREFEATPTRIGDNNVFLDGTAFHPCPSGGLDAD
ncbi:hypothetical protein [Hyperthermus butylicus]|nr:hypothetical protein [Hyperthermus butylicus]